MKTFIDDRTFTSSSASEVLQVKGEWASWSRTLGLVENDSKATFYHASARGRRELTAAGAPADKVIPDPMVLGVQFRGRQNRVNSVKEEGRVSEACRLIRRCAWLPVPWQVKKRVVATQGLSKAVWGWMCRFPP